jgi:ElaB/YqjD/DUF883 family membrane-anchored ribosome-binding protein
MNEQQFDQKIKQDVTQVKNAVNNRIEDGINTVSNDLGHSTEIAEARIKSGVAQFSNEFEKAKDDATTTVADATTKVIKNVGNGLSQFFGKAAEVTKKIPGDVGEKVSEYPWVAIPVVLLAGFFLRGFLMPSRNHRR